MFENYFVPDPAAPNGFRRACGIHEITDAKMERMLEVPFTEGGRRVARTPLTNGWTVSTVFLYFNHAFDDGPPVLFETMMHRTAPGGRFADYQTRYRTYEDAVAGHAATVAVASGWPAVPPDAPDA